MSKACFIKRALAAGCAAAVALTPFGGLAQSPPAAAKAPDQGEVTTVSPLVVRPAGTLPPLPNLTAEQLGVEAQKAYDMAVGELWNSCDQQDSEAEGDYTIPGPHGGVMIDVSSLFNTEARAQAWLRTAALDAEAAVRNAEAVKASGTPEEIAQAEELRVAGLREFQSAQIIATEAHQRVADGQDMGYLERLARLRGLAWDPFNPTDEEVRAVLDESSRQRTTQTGVKGVYVPGEFADLGLAGITVRQITLKGDETAMHITGRIVNPRGKAIAIPPLWFTLLDADGQPLASEQAQAPAFSGSIAAGKNRAFTYDFRHAPKAAVKAVATFAPTNRARRDKPVFPGLQGGACAMPGQQVADLKLGATPPPNAPWVTGIAPTYGINQQLWVMREKVMGAAGGYLPPFHPPQPLVRGSNTPDEISDPKWLKQASPGDVLSAFPARARRLGQDGQATVACKVTEDGRLQDCVVTGETPKDQHFGDQALSLTSKYQMQPTLANGAPVTGAKVTVAIKFTPPPRTGPSAQPQPRIPTPLPPPR